MKENKIIGMHNEPIKGMYNIENIVNTPWYPDRERKWWDEWSWKEPQPTYIYKYIEKEPEEKSELVKDYCEAILTDDEKLGVEMGALDEVGLLTLAGRELLVELFNDNIEVQKAFYDTLKKMKQNKKKEKKGGK